jgi:hypothetical protein
MFEAKISFFVLGILTVKFRIRGDTKPIKKIKKKKKEKHGRVFCSFIILD